MPTSLYYCFQDERLHFTYNHPPRLYMRLVKSVHNFVSRKLKSHPRCLEVFLCEGVACWHFDPHQLSIHKRWSSSLSGIFCCYLYVPRKYCPWWFRRGMSEVTVLSSELLSDPAAFCCGLGMAKNCVIFWCTGEENAKPQRIFFLLLWFYFRISVIIFAVPFFFFPLQKELMESCQNHELINLMKVKTMPAEQGMILIKTNRIFCLFFFLASPDSNITVGKKGLLQFNILQFVS